MNKQRFFKSLTLLGFICIVFMLVGYLYTLKNRGEQIQTEALVDVPQGFSRHFDRVITKQRYKPMGHATFMSPEERRVNWKIFNGNYLLVNFWATWCAPCVLELPSLDKLKTEFEGQGLNVIAVSIDTMRSHPEIKEFLKNRAIGKFAAYLDDVQEVQKNTYMRGIPTTYLLNPKGEILYIFEGDAPWNSPVAVDFFKSVINSKH